MGVGDIVSEVSQFHKSFKDSISAYKQIDFVLSWIKENSDKKLLVTNDLLTQHVIDNRTIIGIKRIRLYQIIDRLNKDGYIIIRGNYKYYDITFDGVIFQGYEIQYLDKVSLLERKNRREMYLIIGSWMAGIGALLLVLIETLKHLGWILSINLMTAWFLFSLGICTGITALLIADKVLQQKAK